MNVRLNFDLSVYFIIDPSLCGGRRVIDVAHAALTGGATMIQYRDKSSPESEVLRMAGVLKGIAYKFQAPLIINDYVEIAQETGADGVHLGQDDMKPVEARKILGDDVIIGQTAFTSEQIRAVDAAVTDYIGVGPFYKTKTDKGKPVLGPEKFKELSAISPVPVVGIGGIVSQNAAEVIKAGADGVAMMRAISEAEDPQYEAQQFLTAVNEMRMRKAS